MRIALTESAQPQGGVVGQSDRDGKASMTINERFVIMQRARDKRRRSHPSDADVQPSSRLRQFLAWSKLMTGVVVGSVGALLCWAARHMHKSA